MSAHPTSRTVPALEDVAWVRRLARGLAADAHQAEDLAQETWVIALERDGLARGRAWLSGVLRHVALKSRRGAQRRAHHEELAARPEAVDAAADIVARAALCSDLAGSVMQLDEPYRSALLLRYLDELPPRAIARRLGVPVGTVTSRLARGRALLRAQLDAKKGGREAWLPAVVALGGGGASTAGAGAGAILMGTKAKVALALAVAAVALLGARELAGRSPEAPVELAQAGPAERAEQGAGLLPAPLTGGARGAVAALGAESVAAAGKLVLRGRVVDGACPELGIAEAPATAAQVRVWLRKEEAQRESSLTPPGAQATTIDGRFSLELEDPGYRPVFFRLQCEEGRTHRAATVKGAVEDASGARPDVLVQRVPFGVLHGIVRDESGAPLAGIRVLGTKGDQRDRVETSSEEGGHFVLAREGGLNRLEVAAPGWAPLFLPAPKPRAEGGYEDVELILAPTGRLIVRLVDAGERPAEGAVRLSLAPEELPPGAEQWAGAGSQQVSLRTDPQGVAEFDQVWLGRKLVIEVPGATSEVRYDKVHEGRLVPADVSTGEALVVPPAGVLEVVARAPSELLIRVSVRYPDGFAVPRPGYEIIDDGRRELDPERRLKAGWGDEAGGVEVRVTREGILGSLVVIATDEESAGKDDAWRRLFGTLGFDRWARIVLDPASTQPSPEASGGVLEATLTLQPTYAISGRVVDAEGCPVHQGFGNRVYAVPAGAGDPHALTSLEREAWTTAGVDGTFRIVGLSEGLYDLYAAANLHGDDTWFSFETGLVRVPDVPAGTAGLDIILPTGGGVRVSVALDGTDEGRAPESIIVLMATLQPSDGRSPSPASVSSIRADTLSAWPPSAAWGFMGAGAATLPEGRLGYGKYSTEEVAGHVLPDLGEGWYVFGVEPMADNKHTHFPVATELVYLRPGEHDVRFTLTPAATLRGRIATERPVGHLAVALVDGSGLPLLQRREDGLYSGFMTTRIPLNAAGEFTFPTAPIGRRTLRVGTPAQLDAGSFQREFEVEITAEPGEPLVLRL